MDEVDYRYKDSINRALLSKDIDRLMELVPSLSYEEAVDYIDKYQRNYQETMEKIRASQDTMKLDNETHEMLFDLLDKAHLSGYHR